ncbi:MAG: hypothetical protein QXY62_01185 [Candidatus Altiarchaeota archaeon]
MLNRGLKNKAQIFTWDLIVSLALFLVTLGLLLYLWNSALWNFSYSKEMYEISWLANTVAEQLIRTPGFQKNWQNSPENVIVFGLAYIDEFNSSQSRILDFDKFLYLLNLTNENYTIVRNKLLGTGKYDFYIEINCLNQWENCLQNLRAKRISNAVINCSNNANFTIVNNFANLQGEPRCIFGRYATPSSSVMMAVEKRTATFENKLNATIQLTIVIWMGETAIIPGITVMTTTSTTATTTTTLPGPQLQCYYATSCGSDTCVLSIGSDYSDAGGAHVADCSIYADKICCKVIDTGCIFSCGSGTCIIRVGSDYTNVKGDHLQDCARTEFTTQIQCNVNCGTFTCAYRDSCNLDESCIASIGSDYNSAKGDHIASCDTYTKKICCKIAS